MFPGKLRQESNEGIGKFKKVLTCSVKSDIIKSTRKPLRQKKGRAGLFERVDYGVSSTKALCVIWTVEGSVKCTDV